MLFINAILLSVLTYKTIAIDSIDEYMKRRQNLIKEERDLIFGSEIKLTDDEVKADQIIMKLKTADVDHGLKNPADFNFSHHYFSYKDDINKSKLYQVIQRMPKGAALHVHDLGILKPDYVVNITYQDHLYVCFNDGVVTTKMLFSDKPPDAECSSEWQLMRDARYSSGNVEEFDERLRREFTIVRHKPQDIYTDINKVWSDFFKIFLTITPMLSYRPIWAQYYYDSLEALRSDGVMYVEFRTTLEQLHELDGTVHPPEYTAQVYENKTKEFLKKHPDFIGAKLIYAPVRLTNNKTMSNYLKLAKFLKEKHPDFMAGFDMVGQEDLGGALINYIPQLLQYKDEIDYFFHAGETNWYGCGPDLNIMDAVLLGSKRIGHAYALPKHPLLMEMVKDSDIAVEVNMISNQVLKLVDDVRNHPLAIFMAHNVPVILSSDDPGLWEAEPMSHDYFISFVGVMNRNTGLRALKKLVWNTIKYSTMNLDQKYKALSNLERDWVQFINTVNGEYSYVLESSFDVDDISVLRV